MTPPFQGKGFRSLGQEAIYAAAIRLRRGDEFRDGDAWRGDVIAPIIRDLGAALAMRPTPRRSGWSCRRRWGRPARRWTARTCTSATWGCGVLPAAAPLSIGTLTHRRAWRSRSRARSGRVAVSFIGEGGSSLGEWHEAINLCAARRLPAVFCVENNQTALSTPVREQSAARVFADKAAGYGIPRRHDRRHRSRRDRRGVRLGGRARARRPRPALIELVSMRMCGHAHHDDMLYLGKDPQPGGSIRRSARPATPIPSSTRSGRRAIRFPTYAARLDADGSSTSGDLDRLKRKRTRWSSRGAGGDRGAVAGARRAPAPACSPDDRRACESKCSIREVRRASTADAASARARVRPPFDQRATFLEAVMLGVGDALRRSAVFVFGEDVGGQLRQRVPAAAAAPRGVRRSDPQLAARRRRGARRCVGAALAGQRPIGEMQFNDFVATGFNQLVNNAAKIRYRWGGSVPMVVRMPWGGLRHAGPYHSQNTEPWFYRTPGLKIVVPSTPHDARALMARAVADPDPVLYYEHIALYRDPRIKQALAAEPPAAAPDRPRRAPAGGRRPRHHLVWRLRARRAAGRRAARRRRHRGERARPAIARAARSRGGPGLRRATAAASSSSTRTRGRAASARAWPRHPGRAFEWLDAPSASSARSTRRSLPL